LFLFQPSLSDTIIQNIHSPPSDSVTLLKSHF
jgi:hypothetical protein